jgi:hypothetical protein
LGKTQLAVEYAYRYQSSYPSGVIWLNADLNRRVAGSSPTSGARF